MLNRFAVGLGDACRGAFAKDAKRAAAITPHTSKMSTSIPSHWIGRRTQLPRRDRKAKQVPVSLAETMRWYWDRPATLRQFKRVALEPLGPEARVGRC